MQILGAWTFLEPLPNQARLGPRAPNRWDRSLSVFGKQKTFGILSVAKPLNLQEVGDMVVNLGGSTLQNRMLMDVGLIRWFVAMSLFGNLFLVVSHPICSPKSVLFTLGWWIEDGIKSGGGEHVHLPPLLRWRVLLCMPCRFLEPIFCGRCKRSVPWGSEPRIV